jgi:hypothetical protein
MGKKKAKGLPTRHCDVVGRPELKSKLADSQLGGQGHNAGGGERACTKRGTHARHRVPTSSRRLFDMFCGRLPRVLAGLNPPHRRGSLKSNQGPAKYQRSGGLFQVPGTPPGACCLALAGAGVRGAPMGQTRQPARRREAEPSAFGSAVPSHGIWIWVIINMHAVQCR